MGGWLGLLGTSGIKEEGLEVGNWLNGSGRMFAALPQSHRVTQGLGGCGVEQVAAWQDVVIMCRWTAGETGANHQMHKRIHRQRLNEISRLMLSKSRFERPLRKSRQNIIE